MAQTNPIYLMRLFVNIVHMGSFNAAAQKMRITASKASKDIQNLESELQSTLLNRTTRSVGITDAGQIYYQKAVEILESYEEMLDKLNHSKRELAGELRVTAPDMWGKVVLTPLIFKFRDQFPEVSFRATYTNKLVDPIRDNLHIAFRTMEPTNEPYLAKLICDDGLTLCASPQYLETIDLPQTIDDLKSLNFITFTEPDNPYEILEFKREGKPFNIQVTGKLSFDNKFSVYDAVLGGQGLACLPSYLVRQKIEEGSLIELLPEFQLSSMHFYALYAQHRKDSALVSSFIDFVRTNIEE